MSQPSVEPERLRALIDDGAQPTILDVRSAREYANGHVPGAVNIPFWRVATASIPASVDDPIVVYCGHGPRAAFALMLLSRRGFTRVACLRGHMSKWREAGRPEERGPRGSAG
jgi:rhodanese-related sulfurtransferase